MVNDDKFSLIAMQLRKSLDESTATLPKLPNRNTIDFSDYVNQDLISMQGYNKNMGRMPGKVTTDFNRSIHDSMSPVHDYMTSKDYQNSTGSSSSSFDGSLSDYSGSLSPDSFEFGFDYQAMLQRQRRARKPPDGYLCHLCFCKGHYIKDCPEVSILRLSKSFGKYVYTFSEKKTKIVSDHHTT